MENTAIILRGTPETFLKNETTQETPTIIGMMLGIANLVVMSLITICLGAFRSISCLQKNRHRIKKHCSAEIISLEFAIFAPFVASIYYLTLLYIFSKSTEEFIDLYRIVITTLAGVICLTKLLRFVSSSPFILKLIPVRTFYGLSHIKLNQDTAALPIITSHVIAFGISSTLGSIYLWNKNWILNNIFGIAIAVGYIEIFFLNDLCNGLVLLLEFAFFDAYWIFMSPKLIPKLSSNRIHFASVAYLVCPFDLLENWPGNSNFLQLAVADVAIPGMFISFLLRFDESLKRGQKLYFYSSLFAYFLGVLVTIITSEIFECPQSMLTYCVTYCITTVFIIARIKGDTDALLNYCDFPSKQPTANVNQ